MLNPPRGGPILNSSRGGGNSSSLFFLFYSYLPPLKTEGQAEIPLRKIRYKGREEAKFLFRDQSYNREVCSKEGQAWYANEALSQGRTGQRRILYEAIICRATPKSCLGL